jgi:hypothetical protein
MSSRTYVRAQRDEAGRPTGAFEVVVLDQDDPRAPAVVVATMSKVEVADFLSTIANAMRQAEEEAR